MRMKLKLMMTAGVLCLGLLCAALPAVAAEQDYTEEMEILREKNTEYVDELIAAQQSSDEQRDLLSNPEMQQLLMLRQQESPKEEKKKKYNYKSYTGKKGLEGVQMPQRLFNNIPDSR